MRARPERYETAVPGYPGIGGTRTGTVPPGYIELRRRFLIGAGEMAMASAADAVLSWRMHRATGMRIAESTPRAAEGVTMVGEMGVGPLRVVVPCRVIWAEDLDAGRRHAAFGYGTLPGHPEKGEEAFRLDRDSEGRVWLSVLSFTRPGCWFTRLAGPAVPVVQSMWLRRAATCLRGMV